MRVLLYKGGFRSVQKSGVGRAILHQEAMLQCVGMPMAATWVAADVVHINTVFPDSVCAAILARLQGKKVVYYGHSTREDFRNSFCGSNVLAPLFCYWIKFCYSLGDVILTPTEYSRKLLVEYGLKKPVYALSNGVDIHYFCPSAAGGAAFRKQYGLSPGDKVVISVGHYIERKGILDFIELARRMPQVHFFWFGYTKPYLIPRRVRQAIRHAPANLHFPGYINAEALRNAYCGADAFVFLSREETEGIVVLEALACGVPVVLRDIPVYSPWLENGRHVCKVSDVTQAEEAVCRIVEGQQPLLVNAGQEAARERSLERIGARLCSIYRREGFCGEVENRE